MVVREFYLSKKRQVGIAAMCVVLAVSLTGLWPMGQVAEAAILDPHPGLVGWWRFDEGTGILAGDSSGNENSGDIYGTTWVTGKYDQAISFNGVNNYVIVQDSNSLDFGIATDFSISFWFNPTATDWHLILNKKDVSLGTTAGYQFTTLNDGLYAFIGDGTNGIIVTSTYISKGVWQFCTLVAQRNSTAKWYINGILSGNPVSMTSLGNLDNSRNLYIGGSDSYYNGMLDEVRIYNRVLSPAEIEADFQNGPDFSGTLLAKVPKGTTQVITTLTWKGAGSINVTIISHSQSYTEEVIPVYQKTTFSTSDGTSKMFNIKRLSVSVIALSSEQIWYIELAFDSAIAYQISVEVQK